ncbi:MAG: sulfotransferase [Deltaproteobacteria bacterium]|nr:sulfotransferase [Deltaproteobacteria bacterium]
MSSIEYNFWQKLLHKIAIGNYMISEFSLDLEIGRTRVDLNMVEKNRHVFISGLARAGTTILLRRLYNTGAFTSLTYRDMPFVLMPLFWKLLSGKSKKTMEKIERAHGDGLDVDYDSPEAFEEVFWKTVGRDEYIKKDRLLPHNPDEKTLKKFKHYLGLILESRKYASGKYLSKNNNNILRMKALCEALPESNFLILFRSPLQQAWSLQQQHQRFLAPADPFTTKYMNWLGHYEFGAGHKPFDFSRAENTFDPATLPYWLFLWNEVYSWLIAQTPQRVIFISYDELCNDRGQTWNILTELAGVEDIENDLEPFRLIEHDIQESIPKNLLKASIETHQLLLDRHKATF